MVFSPFQMGIFTPFQWASYCQDGMAFLGLPMGMFPMFYRYFLLVCYVWIMDIQVFDLLIQSSFFAINGDIYQPYFLNKGAHCRMSKIGHRNRWGMVKGM